MKKALSLTILFFLLYGFTYPEGQQEETTFPTLEEIGYNPDSFPLSQIATDLEILIPMKPQMKDPEGMRVLYDVAEKAGIDLTLKGYPLSVYHQKKNLLFASGDLPDIFWGMMSMTADQMKNYGIEEQLLELTPYLHMMPNLSAALDQYPDILENMKDREGNIYGLPFILDGVKAPYRAKMFINKKWLDKLDLDMPGTIEELTHILIAFRDGDPNGNGKKDEIPFALSDIATETAEISGFPLLFSAFGRHGSGFVVEGDQVVFAPAQQEYKEAVEYFSNWYREGLVNSDCFYLNVLDYWKIYKTGEDSTVGVLFGDQSLFDVISEKHAGEYVPLPPLAGIDGETRWHRYYRQRFGFNIGAAIAADTPYPEIAVRYLDQFYSFENSVELFLGALDSSIYRDSDGRYGYKESEGKTIQDLRYSSSTGDGPIMITYQSIREGIIPDYNESHNSLYRNYYANTLPSYIYPKVEYTEDEKEKISQISVDISNYVLQKRAEWISGEALSDSEWDEYIGKLNAMGLQEIISIKEKAFVRSGLIVSDFEF